MRLEAKEIGKYFAEKLVFKNINFSIHSGQSLAITGPNGSGKTTLVRILCRLIRPSQGRVIYALNEEPIAEQHTFRYVGLVGPYLELYEELSAWENLYFFAKMRNIESANRTIMDLLEKIGLQGRENDSVKNYSSGMRQRLKYAFALLHSPEILFLDEPTSNLDRQGIQIVNEIMQAQKKDKILIIATNDASDLKYGDYHIAVNA